MSDKAKVFGLVDSNGLIVNSFYWSSDPAEYPVDPGFSVVRIDNVENCGIGWSYINGQFSEPVEDGPVRQPTVEGAQTL